MIGGGLTGAGTARDLALRGLSVLLLDKGDWGGGASGASNWVVQAESEETGRLVRAARHLVRRCVTLVPLLPGDGRHDRFQPRLRLTGVEARRLEPGLAPDITAARLREGWGVDAHRLAWANVLDAIRAGARALNHTRVEALLRDDGRVVGVRYRAHDGQRIDARARMVVNAAGPWAPGVAAVAGARVALRPTREVQVAYDRRLSNFAISAQAVDGRDVLLVPRGAGTFLGATVGDHYGDLDALEVLPDEADHLLQAAERVFPAIREYRPVRAAASVRPNLPQWGGRADELSRRFELVDHDRTDGMPGLLTVVGGGLDLYRLKAERASDAVCARLGIETRSPTADRPLPGASGVAPPAAELASEHGIPALAAARLLERQGSEAPDVLHDTRRGRLVCRCEALTEAELIHALRHEHVRTLADAFRRTGLAAGPCAGTSCLERAAEVLGQELGWSAAQRREACRDYQTSAWRGRAPVLDRWGWAQEELAYGLRRGWPGGL